MKKNGILPVFACILLLILASCGSKEVQKNAPSVQTAKEDMPFSSQEIKKAQEVIQQYFQSCNENDIENYNRCVVRTRKVENSQDIFVGANRKVKNITLDNNFSNREYTYLYNTGEANLFPPKDVIVFQVDYELSFNSKEAEAAYSLPPGLVKNYQFTLVRDSKEGPWLINGWGY